MSVHPVVAEIDAINLADAYAEWVKCDECPARGTRWFGGFWLCTVCWLRAEARLVRFQ